MSGLYNNGNQDMPTNYDTGLGPVTFINYARDMARRAAAGAPSNVLETACGTGIVTRALLDALPEHTRLTSTDLTPAMLAAAKAKFSRDDRVVFQQADATALPFPDASFDTVICQFGTMFFPDKDKGYREAHRVLTPGGRYLFSVWDSLVHNPWARLSHETATRLLPAGQPIFSAMPFAYHMIDPIKEALIAAGFSAIEVSVVRFEQTVTDMALFAHGMVFGSPLGDQIRQYGGIEPSQVKNEIVAAFKQYFGGDSAVLPMQAIVFKAQKPA